MNHNWHRDTNHDTHLLKAFIFSLIATYTGAHHYIAGSVNDARFHDKPILQITKSLRYGPPDLTTIWSAMLRRAPIS